MIRSSFLRTLALASVFVIGLSASATAGTRINLRVEGAKATLYDGSISVIGGKLTSRIGEDRGSHSCNVADNGGRGVPAVTPTRALFEASAQTLRDRLGPLRLEWYESFSDFIVGSIGDEAPSGNSYWELSVNWKVAQVGGCAIALKDGDEVLWAVSDGATPSLRLLAPKTARRGRQFNVRVTDGATGKGVAGAHVGGETTGAGGIAKLTLRTGTKRLLRATKTGSTRSSTEAIELR